MAIILSSLLYARAPQPLRPTPHTPFFSLLWAVWTLIDELRGQWMEDGTRMRMRGTSRYVQIVSFSSLSSISCISAAPFHFGGGGTHFRGRRRYAQVLLSRQASVFLFCPAFLTLRTLCLFGYSALSQFTLCQLMSILIPCFD